MRYSKPVLTAMVVMTILSLTITTVGAQGELPPVEDALPPEVDPGIFTNQPPDFVPEETGLIYVDAKPIPISPSGSVYVRKPKLRFYKDFLANRYKVELYSFNTNLTETITGVGTCTEMHCYLVPAQKLFRQTYWDDGDYRWRVTARYGTTWQSPSGWMNFRVISAGFDDSFVTINPLGARWWKSDSIEWTWNSTKTQLKTLGSPGKWTGILAEEEFIDVDYTVRMKRKGTSTTANLAFIWGSPYSLDSNNGWNDWIGFSYYNNGDWAISKRVDGVSTLIHYANNLTAINEFGWNELRIVVAYPYVDLWMNGYYLGWFEPGSVAQSYGYVGFAMFGDDSTSPLLVDWARVKSLDMYKVEAHDPAMQLGLEPVTGGVETHQ